MEIVMILVKQIAVMFIFAGIGALLFQCGKISPEGSKTLGNILIYLVLPCVIVKGFCVDKSRERMIALAVSALVAAAVLFISVLVSKICFKQDAIAVFASSFSNPGFFGIPLIISVLGDDAVFLVTAFIGFLNLLQWTFGVRIMTGMKQKTNIASIMRAPFMIAILTGLFLFFTGIPVPSIISTALVSIADINTPLAMITVGVYLAQTDLPGMLVKGRLYCISFVRLVCIPLICMGFMYFIPDSLNELKLAVLICAACPAGSNVAVYAQLHGKDYRYAVETVVISTIFSIVTIPAIIYMAAYIC